MVWATKHLDSRDGEFVWFGPHSVYYCFALLSTFGTIKLEYEFWFMFDPFLYLKILLCTLGFRLHLHDTKLLIPFRASLRFENDQ